MTGLEQLPKPMQDFLSMIDETLERTPDRAAKLKVLNQSVERVERRAANFQAWAMGGLEGPCPESSPVHADDFVNVLQAVENRREAIIKVIRQEIAEAEGAPQETPRLLADLAQEIVANITPKGC